MAQYISIRKKKPQFCKMQIQLLPASINHERDAGLVTKSTFQKSFLLIISWPDIGVNPTMPHFFSRIMKGVPKNKAGPRKDEGMVLEPGLHKHIKICHAFSFPSCSNMKQSWPFSNGLPQLKNGAPGSRELPSCQVFPTWGGAPVFFGDPEKMRFEDEQVRRHWHGFTGEVSEHWTVGR